MSAAPKRRMTAEEYLAFEVASPFKHEYFDGQLWPKGEFTERAPDGTVGMAAALPPHNIVKDNLIFLLGSGLRSAGGHCRTLSSDQRISNGTGSYFYPDIVIFCGRAEASDTDRMILLNPAGIVEVLSPGTERVDRGAKTRLYLAIPSMQAYLLVAPDRVSVDCHLRQPDGSWNLVTLTDLAATLSLPPFGVALPLAEVYRDAEFGGAG